MTKYCTVTEDEMQEIVELIKRFHPVNYKEAQHWARVLHPAKASLENSVGVAGYTDVMCLAFTGDTVEIPVGRFYKEETNIHGLKFNIPLVPIMQEQKKGVCVECNSVPKKLLTNDEIQDLIQECSGPDDDPYFLKMKFARLIEKALGITQ